MYPINDVNILVKIHLWVEEHIQDFNVVFLFVDLFLLFCFSAFLHNLGQAPVELSVLYTEFIKLKDFWLFYKKSSFLESEPANVGDMCGSVKFDLFHGRVEI